ncbi:MAG: peptide chain release factor N(5)-glutamine methyltransferase, partial [Muribaculaceae bacterium]|nr:peptide chain release factor N(5)-glutamine methyltransferase [Muribaculaceae bacterium]
MGRVLMEDDNKRNITTEERYRLLRRELMPLFGSGEATAMARLIFHALKGWDTTDLVVHAGDILSPFITARIEEIVKRLATGEPLQYILGEGRFYGMNLKVDRSTLIPRPETEELVEAIVRQYESRSDLRVLDVGTGSGAIAIALSRNLRFAEVTALDVSGAALRVAEENARARHARIRFIEADIFDWLPAAEEYDIIVSNPPYICEKEKTAMERNV